MVSYDVGCAVGNELPVGYLYVFRALIVLHAHGFYVGGLPGGRIVLVIGERKASSLWKVGEVEVACLGLLSHQRVFQLFRSVIKVGYLITNVESHLAFRIDVWLDGWIVYPFPLVGDAILGTVNAL